jgi:CRISPR system Cascade subunit CasD
VSELELLALRFEAPLMSFGGVTVDEHNVTAAFPGKSLLTGLLANALGYRHGDADRLSRLQDRLRMGARRDRKGVRLVDYQTVDLGQDFLRQGWTTRGVPEGREGGSAKTGTHIRHRHYWADAVFTVVLRLEPADETPTLAECATALAEPERPLFLGRKTCLPSGPVLIEILRAPSIRDALALAAPAGRREEGGGSYVAWWPREDEPAPPPGQGRLVPVFDERDWLNQIHAGRRFVWEGRVEARDIGGGGEHDA